MNAFIATQGPVPDSVPDFWRMVWEQGTATIVMLTNLEEKGRVRYINTHDQKHTCPVHYSVAYSVDNHESVLNDFFCPIMK